MQVTFRVIRTSKKAFVQPASIFPLLQNTQAEQMEILSPSLSQSMILAPKGMSFIYLVAIATSNMWGKPERHSPLVMANIERI